MSLTPGFHDVPRGHLATVVTHLEMLEKPAPRSAPDLPDLELVRHATPDLDWYRDLFRRVGEDFLWFSRVVMSDADLRAILIDPGTHLYSLQRDGNDLGMLELDFREAGQCELAFFGLDKSLIGSGAGRVLMNQALRLAWAQPISRLHVHTCTLDSPQAVPFYIRSGFTPYRTEVEIAPDPRLSGHFPLDAAPQIPLIASKD